MSDPLTPAERVALNYVRSLSGSSHAAVCKAIDRFCARLDDNERYIEAKAAICEELRARVEKLRAALAEISEGRGAYSMDRFTHAVNTIEDMKALAVAALDEDVKCAS